MQGMVVFVDVAHIVSDQLIPSVVFLLDVSVVELVEHLVALGSVLSALGEEPADAYMVPMLDAAFFRTVELLGVFLL